MVLTVSFVLSPVIGLFVTVILRVFSQDLMPASRHQDHTTSPSAVGALVLSIARVHRIPTRVDDVAQRPSVGQDTRLVELICPTGKAEYFCEQDWTGRIALICFSNLAFTRNGPQGVKTCSPDGAKRNPGRRSDRWINPSPKRKCGEAASPSFECVLRTWWRTFFAFITTTDQPLAML
jgi:hypothetical protein